MAVNDLERDFLRMQHQADSIQEIIAGVRMRDAPDEEKKSQVGNLVRYLEMELLDSNWVDNGKDVSGLQAIAASGRAYWLG